MPKSWRERPREQAALLNPPFLASLLAQGCTEYTRLSGQAMPTLLSMVAVPLVLSRRLRTTLPGRSTTSIPVWLDQHPESLAYLKAVAGEFVPIVRQALVTGIQLGVLELAHDDRDLAIQSVSANPPFDVDTDEAGELKRSMRLVGRWLADAGKPASVLALVGIVP